VTAGAESVVGAVGAGEAAVTLDDSDGSADAGKPAAWMEKTV